MTFQTALMNPKTMMIAASAGMLALGAEAIIVPKFMDSAYDRYVVSFPLKATVVSDDQKPVAQSRKYRSTDSKNPVS